MKRVIFDIFLFLSVFILPWYVTLFLALIGIFIFNNFYEWLAVSIVMYALYATPNGDRIINSKIYFPLIVSLTYIGVQALRRSIILYKS